MSQRVGGSIGPLELFGKRDHMGRGVQIRARDHEEVLRRLRKSKRDPAEMAAIRRWAYDQGFGTGWTDEQLLAKIAKAACSGRIFLAEEYVDKAPSGGGGSSGRGDRSKPDERRKKSGEPRRKGLRPRTQRSGLGGAVPPSTEDADTRTWIEFRLLDDTTDKPISGVAFRIKLTDGSVVTNTTNGAGLIRIDGIDPGTCGIEEIAADAAPEVTNVT